MKSPLIRNIDQSVNKQKYDKKFVNIFPNSPGASSEDSEKCSYPACGCSSKENCSHN